MASLTAKAGAVAGSAGAVGPAADDLDVAKAQLGLDQDELSDSMEDLARASGDHRGKIQQELSARQAAMKKYDMQATEGDGQAAVVMAGQYTTLAGQISEWWAQRTRLQLIQQAEQLARADVAALTADHARLGPEAQAAEAKTAAEKAAGESSSARVKELQREATQRNILSILDDRLGAQQQLVTLYVRGWGSQGVQLQHKMMLHLMLRSLTLIATIVLLTILAGWALQAMFDRMSRDRRQRQTLRIILNLGTQVIGLLLVLLVICGTPQVMPTILGLATAGLTVVFQDAHPDVLWLVCADGAEWDAGGRLGGDRWSWRGGGGNRVVPPYLAAGDGELDGGMCHSRLAACLFPERVCDSWQRISTSPPQETVDVGDEIKVSIPPGAQAYPLIDKIREAAMKKATQADAKMAEEEWKRVTHEEGSPHFSATPSVDMRPAGPGVDIVVRYVTRAGVRLETRNRLFETVVELMLGAAR